MNEHRLWYDRPAAKWLAALPVGNGRMGAMVFGRVRKEWIQLNEDSLWTARKESRLNPLARENLDEMRRLIMAGDVRRAQFLGENTMFGMPPDLTTYETLSNLVLLFDGQYDEAARDYRRELDLETGIASVSYRLTATAYRREVLASAGAGCIVVRLDADRPGALTFSLSFWRRYQNNLHFRAIADDLLALKGQCGLHGVKHETLVRVVPEGGSSKASGDHLVVTGADAATIFIVCATDFRHADYAGEVRRQIETVSARPWAELKREHLADHEALYGRMQLELEVPPEQGALSALPTDERLGRVRTGGEDDGLAALAFAYGRYLLMSASRPGTLPTNLQGIWNDTIAPAWDSKFTININEEMHYWPAETTNLSETHEALFELIGRMLENGREVARVHYGCRGFVAHHNTDIWADCVPLDNVFCGLWPLGAAWLVLHLWDHYEFAPDDRFLRERAYPLMKEAAEFLVDFAFEDEAGRLMIGPTISPENAWRGADGERLALCLSPTMDVQITRALFDRCIRATEILGTDADFAETLERLREKLPPTRIDGEGRIAEWLADVEEYEPGHRHNSHLFGLYPDDQITLEGTPELARAAGRSLDHRIANGGAGPCWSRAWIAGLMARLGRGDEVREHVLALLKESTDSNLFSMHPPQGSNPVHVFQIDGNLGLTAAMAEAIVQSHGGIIRLLPALPRAWPSGNIKGLRARGGFELSLEWRDGDVRAGSIVSGHGLQCVLSSKVPLAIVDSLGATVACERRVHPPGSHLASFETRRGEAYGLAVQS
jgi:alpha-L-fucosidase 2